MKRGVCYLCGCEAELLNRSHIIPDFMYEPAYDDKHRLILFSPAKEVSGDGKFRRPPSAPYDSGILCKECDNVTLGKLEGYAAQILFGKNLKPSIAPQVQNYKDPSNGFGETHTSNLDYAQLKLFILSILWRAHISKQSFFSEVNLGPWEPVMRSAIIKGQPLDENTFPVFFLGWVTTSSVPTDMVSQPVRFRWKGKDHVYMLMFRGLIALIFVSRDADTTTIDRHKLKEDGTLKILNLPDRAMRDFFSKVFKIDPNWV